MKVSVVDWLDRPEEATGVHFASDDDGWDFCSYAELARDAAKVGGGLKARDVRRNDVVATVLPSGPEFVCSVFGSWIAGASICPIVPPGPFEDEEAYTEHLAGLLRVAHPSVVVTDSHHSKLVVEASRRARVEPLLLKDPLSCEEIDRTPAPRVALVQFTSGSTGNPRGVCVRFSNLDANIEMIRSWVEWDETDATASWLPLFHDMGLIGCLLASAASQTDLYVMRPDQFIRSPARWVRCFDSGRATLTAAPSFAFAYTARRVSQAALEGLDLSHWKTAVVGAEPIDGAALQAFAKAMAPFGFSARTYRAAYGLAEATLAATGIPLRQLPHAIRIPAATLEMGKSVQVADEVSLAADSIDLTSDWVIGCGPAFDGVDVEVVGADARPLPPGHLGQIVIQGDLVAAGYLGDSDSGQTKFLGKTLMTGDAGFFFREELYVLGRIGESVKVRGRHVFVEDVESRVAASTDLSLGQFAIISSPGTRGQSVVVICERGPGEWVDGCRDVLRREFGASVSVNIVCCNKGTIRRTSSGKPRRRLMWELYTADGLGGVEVGPHMQATGA